MQVKHYLTIVIILIISFPTISFLISSAGAQSNPNTAYQCAELETTSVPRDGISSIDSPSFLSATTFEKEFSQSYLNTIRVVGISIDGEARAYPLDILIQHEIVNDRVNGKPISITYCPLTGSAIVFKTALIGGSTIGTTGSLLWNNLIFYDRDSETYWSQMYNVAWCGARHGSLELAPVVETTWQAWKMMHPNTKVLSRDTGYIRNYDVNPYGTYDADSLVLFPAPWKSGESPYNLYHAKELSLVLSLSYADDLETFIFPYSELSTERVVNFQQGNRTVVVFYDSDNSQAMAFLSTLSNGTTLQFNVETLGQPRSNDMNMTTFKDTSGSIWNINGKAIAGPLQDMQLVPIPGYSAYWFAATSFFIKARYFIGGNFFTQVFDNGTYSLTDFYSAKEVNQSNLTQSNAIISSPTSKEPITSDSSFFFSVFGFSVLSIAIVIKRRYFSKK